MFVPDYAVNAGNRMIILSIGVFANGDVIYVEVGEPDRGSANPTLHLSILDPVRKCYAEEVALIDMPQDVINLLYSGSITVRDVDHDGNIVDIEVLLNEQPASSNEGTETTVTSHR